MVITEQRCLVPYTLVTDINCEMLITLGTYSILLRWSYIMAPIIQMKLPKIDKADKSIWRAARIAAKLGLLEFWLTIDINSNHPTGTIVYFV